MTATIRMYLITHRPTDLPFLEYVIRIMNVTAGQVTPEPAIYGSADTLDQARALLPPDVDTCFPRDPSDPPVVVETWM